MTSSKIKAYNSCLGAEAPFGCLEEKLTATTEQWNQQIQSITKEAWFCFRNNLAAENHNSSKYLSSSMNFTITKIFT